ncbi:MAG TPA: DUF2786 domain-containing protein [Candidatus Obscuribacterales bacterium]
MHVEESITSKIKKLLALADGNSNEHEREVAMQFAMDLLAKHNLTVEQLGDACAHSEVQEMEGQFRLEPWIRIILDTACTLYYTDYYVSTRESGSRYDFWFGYRTLTRNVPVFVGTAENITVTIDVATWLINSVRLESNRMYKDNKLRRSFRLGAAHALLKRARKIVEDERCASKESTGTALMVLRNKLQRANQEYLDSLDLQSINYRTLRVAMSAYNAGEAYGDQVALPSRNATSSPALIG